MDPNYQSPERHEDSQKHRAASEADCLRAAEELRQSKNAIKELWEKRVRERILEAQGKTSLVIINTLGIFLDELVNILAKKITSPKILSEEGMAKLHGK